MRHIKINIQRVHPHMQNIMTGHYFLWLWWSLTSAAAILSTHRQLSRHYSWQLLAHTCKKRMIHYLLNCTMYMGDKLCHGLALVIKVLDFLFQFSNDIFCLFQLAFSQFEQSVAFPDEWGFRSTNNYFFVTQTLYWHQQCARKGKRQISIRHQFAGDRKTLECCK